MKKPMICAKPGCNKVFDSSKVETFDYYGIKVSRCPACKELNRNYY